MQLNDRRVTGSLMSDICCIAETIFFTTTFNCLHSVCSHLKPINILSMKVASKIWNTDLVQMRQERLH